MTQSLEAARDSLRADLAEVKELLAPAEFVSRAGPGYPEVRLDCPVPDGGSGNRDIFRGWKAEGPFEDPKTKADSVAQLWESKGYAVKKRYAEGFDYEVLAASTEDNTLVFGIGGQGQAMTLGGETVCLPTGEDAPAGT